MRATKTTVLVNCPFCLRKSRSAMQNGFETFFRFFNLFRFEVTVPLLKTLHNKAFRYVTTLNTLTDTRRCLSCIIICFRHNFEPIQSNIIFFISFLSPPTFCLVFHFLIFPVTVTPNNPAFLQFQRQYQFIQNSCLICKIRQQNSL